MASFLFPVQTTRAADGGVSCCQWELSATNMEGTHVRSSEFSSLLMKHLHSSQVSCKHLVLSQPVCVCAKYYVICVKQDSPIIDFYPEDFAIDLNGKKYAWQGNTLIQN